MKHQHIKYFALLSSLFIFSCGSGLEVREQPTVINNVDSNTLAFNINVNGLDKDETVFLRYKLNIEAFDENQSFSLPSDGSEPNESDFSVVYQPCMKNCELVYNELVSAETLPELTINCSPKQWRSVEPSLNTFLSSASTSAFNPSLDINNSGEIGLLWREATGSSSKVVYQNKESSVWNNLDQEQVLSLPNTSSQYVDIASNDNGKAFSVWQGLKNGFFAVYSASYQNDQGWSTVTDSSILSPLGSHVFRPQLAYNNNNEALAVWAQINNNGVNQVFFAEYINGQWFQPSSVNDSSYSLSPASTFATDVEVKLENNGRALVSWRQINHMGEFQVFIAERINGQWIKPQNIADHISPTGSQVTGAPAIDLNSNGEVILSWSQINFDENADRIFHASRVNNVWEFPVNINTFVQGGEGIISGKPSVSINDSGEAYLTWSQQQGNDFEIYAAYKNSAGEWTYPSSASDHLNQALSTGSSYNPVVKVNQEGRAMFTWTSYDNASASNVYSVAMYQGETQGVYNQLSNSNQSSAENLVFDFNDRCEAVVAWTHRDSNQNRQVFVNEIL